MLKVTLLTALLSASCSESLLDKVDPNGGTPESFYSTTDELTRGVNSIYAVAQSNKLAAREWFFLHDLRSDDVSSGGGQLETPRNQILTGSHTTANFVVDQVWSGYYVTIHRANSVIVGSANTKNITDELKKRLVAEARFLRAWAYSDLVILWGGVPLYKEPVTSLADSKPRATVDEINTFIIAELRAIQADLPTTYDKDNVGRVARGAAQALLGRVLMNTGDYAGAKAELDKVRTSGVYSLMDRYEDNFLEETAYNKESIFEIGFAGANVNWANDGNTPSWGGVNEANTRTQEYSSVGWRNLIPSDGLLAEFERVSNGSPKDDPRFAASFIRHGDPIVNGTKTLDTANVQGNLSTFEGRRQKVSWRKYTSIYKTDATFYTGPMNMRVIRYAEVLLNLAECENELGNSAAAIGYLNQVRSRPSVAMPAYPTSRFPVGTKAEIFRAIVHERRVEFAGEQLRNRDILRWRRQNKLTSEPISYFQANKFELLPIPQGEFSTNAQLKSTDQNPGY